MSEDLLRRWREAKIGERRNGRVTVTVECEGDPRAEVIAALSTWRETVRFEGPPEAFGLPGGASGGEVEMTAVDRESGTVTVSSPKRRRRRGEAS